MKPLRTEVEVYDLARGGAMERWPKGGGRGAKHRFEEEDNVSKQRQLRLLVQQLGLFPREIAR